LVRAASGPARRPAIGTGIGAPNGPAAISASTSGVTMVPGAMAVTPIPVPRNDSRSARAAAPRPNLAAAFATSADLRPGVRRARRPSRPRPGVPPRKVRRHPGSRNRRASGLAFAYGPYVN
jgi:hypothetical protein